MNARRSCCTCTTQYARREPISDSDAAFAVAHWFVGLDPSRCDKATVSGSARVEKTRCVTREGCADNTGLFALCFYCPQRRQYAASKGRRLLRVGQPKVANMIGMLVFLQYLELIDEKYPLARR
jgi:hypothetical protein